MWKYRIRFYSSFFFLSMWRVSFFHIRALEWQHVFGYHLLFDPNIKADLLDAFIQSASLTGSSVHTFLTCLAAVETELLI